MENVALYYAIEPATKDICAWHSRMKNMSMEVQLNLSILNLGLE